MDRQRGGRFPGGVGGAVCGGRQVQWSLPSAWPSCPAGPTTALTNPHASSTRLDEGTATGATLSATRSVTITSGQRLVASVIAAMGATGTLTCPGGTVSLSQVADYPVFEGETSYATLGGTGGPVTVTVTIDATTTAPSPEWRWSLVSRS